MIVLRFGNGKLYCDEIAIKTSVKNVHWSDLTKKSEIRNDKIEKLKETKIP